MRLSNRRALIQGFANLSDDILELGAARSGSQSMRQLQFIAELNVGTTLLNSAQNFIIVLGGLSNQLLMDKDAAFLHL